MIVVAKIGKTVGVKGDLKLQIFSDFPQIFNQHIEFYASKGSLLKEVFPLKIKHYKEGLVCFEGYESLESAKSLTNAVLKMKIEDTRRLCSLDEGEFFWFDILGCEIVEGSEVLGVVTDIERIANVDYLVIGANCGIYEKKLPKTFMIPYIERYILEFSLAQKKIFAQGAREIWFAS